MRSLSRRVGSAAVAGDSVRRGIGGAAEREEVESARAPNVDCAESAAIAVNAERICDHEH